MVPSPARSRIQTLDVARAVTPARALTEKPTA
jgi:hypothetical protein